MRNVITSARSESEGAWLLRHRRGIPNIVAGRVDIAAERVSRKGTQHDSSAGMNTGLGYMFTAPADTH